MGRDSPGFDPSLPSPQPLNQSVAAREYAVNATVAMAVERSGRGSASQKVILPVLGPDFRAASTVAVISC